MNTINIQKSMTYKVTGVEFATVAAACDFGMTNIPSDHQEGLQKFLEDTELAHKPVILIATHSMGDREWKIRAGQHPCMFWDEDSKNEWWYAFSEQDISYVRLESATSGSAITAEEDKYGLWNLTLEVPILENGQPYEGHYYHCFMDAVENLGQEYLSHGVTLVAEGDDRDSENRVLSIFPANLDETDLGRPGAMPFAYETSRTGLWTMWVFTSQGVITKLLWKFQGGDEVEESVSEAELGGITFRVGEAIPEEAVNIAAQCAQ